MNYENTFNSFVVGFVISLRRSLVVGFFVYAGLTGVSFLRVSTTYHGNINRCVSDAKREYRLGDYEGGHLTSRDEDYLHARSLQFCMNAIGNPYSRPNPNLP